MKEKATLAHAGSSSKPSPARDRGFTRALGPAAESALRQARADPAAAGGGLKSANDSAEL
jgi:hypothetical protein